MNTSKQPVVDAAELGSIQEKVDALGAEIALTAIWLDSRSGPSPEAWTDKQWKRYLRSHRTR